LSTPSVTLTDVQPLPAGTPTGVSLVGPSDDLLVATKTTATPQAFTLTINATGCTASACGQPMIVRVPLSIRPLEAPPGTMQDFTTPSPDRPTTAVANLPAVATLTDELLITLGSPHAPGTRAQADSAAAANGAVVSGGIEDLGVYEVRWTTTQDLSARRAGLLAEAGVTAVSDSHIGLVGSNAIPNDWDDDGEQATWPFTQMHAQDAWNASTGSDVTVGIVDVGVALPTHEDLHVVKTLGHFGPENHATHVAGLACATANNHLGLAGMAWGCPIVTNSIGHADSALKTDKAVFRAASDVAEDPDVEVINLSLGYPLNFADPHPTELCATELQKSKLMELAENSREMMKHLFDGARGRQIVWTISAGNDCSPGVPSSWGANYALSNVLTVAATNSDRSLARFSNYGPGVEVAAPGGVSIPGNVDGANGKVGLWSTWTKPCGIFNLSLCSAYGTDFGTSMAAPLVAGVAALVRSAHPDFSAAATASCITSSAGVDVGRTLSRSPFPIDDGDGHPFDPKFPDPSGSLPIVNAAAAVQCAADPPPLTDRPSVSFPDVPEALWTVPMASVGRIAPRPDGTITTTKCSYHNPDDANAQFALQQVARDGSLQWRRPVDGGDCYSPISDAAGNTYFFMSDARGAHLRSVDAQGRVRWTTAILPHQIDRDYYTGPTIGANGDVYFPLYNGFGVGWLIGVDDATGAITLDRIAGFPLGITAYDDGLAIVDGDGYVLYIDYDGNERARYAVPSIYFPALGRIARGRQGSVFLAGGGYQDCGGTGGSTSFSITKVTPAGVAWTWSDPTSDGCERGSAAALPNGGVVVTESAGTRDGHVITLDADGFLRWRTTLAPTDGGQLFAAAPLADEAGIIAVPTVQEYPCNFNPADKCLRLRVAFADQDAASLTLQPVTATNESYTRSTGGDPWGDVALDRDRIYVGVSPYLDNVTYLTAADGLAALSAPGLGADFERALEVSRAARFQHSAFAADTRMRQKRGRGGSDVEAMNERFTPSAATMLTGSASR
jgi:subtilisin family serine protease